MLVLKMAVGNKADDVVIDLRPHGLGIITFCITGIDMHRARVGIEADKRIRIDRRVVFEKREAEKT